MQSLLKPSRSCKLSDFFRYLLLIVLFGGLLFLSPNLTKAGAWEQSTQEDFEKGILDSGLEIKDGEVKPISTKVYEDAEDGETNGWFVYDNDPPGTISNVYDNELKSKVIEVTNNKPDDVIQTGYWFKFVHIHKGPFTIQWKIKSSYDYKVYIVTYTADGFRYMMYNSGEGREYKSENYDIYYLGNTYKGKWETITRNLENDLHKLEPDNEIKYIGGFIIRGIARVDDIQFYSGPSVYTSPILDLGENKVASFDTITWEGNTPQGAKLTLQTRSSSDGQNWSDWSKEYINSTGEKIQSPPNRYLQYRANFDTNNTANNPSLKEVNIEYNRFPLTPTNLSPENEKQLSNKDKLKWQKAIDPDPEDTITYTLEIDDHPEFKSIDSVTTNIQATEIEIDDLNNFDKFKDDTKYFWRIKAVDNHNASSGYTSGENNFILDKINLPPNPPQSGFNPSQGGTVKTQTPTIYWDSGSDPDPNDAPNKLSYIIQIDENNKFDSAYLYSVKPGVTQFTIPDTLEDNTRYYYRIKTKDDEGAESGWSAVQNFIIATGKNPVISVAKTVGINVDKKTKGSSLLLGNLKLNLKRPIVFNYWLAFLLIFITFLFFKRKAVFPFFRLVPLKETDFLLFKKGNDQFHSPIISFNPKTSSLKSKHHKNYKNNGGTITKTKGGKTKTIITTLLLGGIAIVAAGIYYYQTHPSPYKDDGKDVQIGDELTYRIDFKNSGETKATNFNIVDSIPQGTVYVENSSTVNGEKQTDAEDSDYLGFTSNELKFKLKEILPKTSGYVTFKVKVNSRPENNKITNSANVFFDESDGLQVTNQTTNYIKEGGEVSVLGGRIKGIVWNDINGNQKKDEDENGIGEITIKLYEDSNGDNKLDVANDAFVKETKTGSNGGYEFTNISANTYFIQLDETTLPSDSVVTTENNPQILTVEKNQEYTGVNFGVSLAEDSLIVSGPTGSIKGLVWNDSNRNGLKDPQEAGLENINIKLFEDTNSSGNLEEDSDFFVVSKKTDANGNYDFTGLSSRDYLVQVDENTVPSNYQLTTESNPRFVKLESDSQEYSDVNFGYALGERGEKEVGVKEVETISSLPVSMGGPPSIIKTPEDENKSNTVSITPIKVSAEDKEGKVKPPVLTHIGSAEVGNFDKKFSVPLDKDLVFRGKAGSNFTVIIFIYSDLSLKSVTTADKDGIWEFVVNSKFFEAGEHRVFAQAKDLEGNLSKKVEIARFKINKEKAAKKGYIFYWVALVVLFIIAFALGVLTWIKGKKKKKK